MNYCWFNAIMICVYMYIGAPPKNGGIFTFDKEASLLLVHMYVIWYIDKYWF